jgi:hypothetical protein
MLAQCHTGLAVLRFMGCNVSRPEVRRLLHQVLCLLRLVKLSIQAVAH